MALSQTVVDGKVVGGAGYKPVAGVTAYLINKSLTPQVIRTQVTDAAGHYQFDDCVPGDGYTVNVYDAGGNLIGTDPQFNLYPDSHHTAVPFLDISRPIPDDKAQLAGGRSLDAATSLGGPKSGFDPTATATPATVAAPADPEATLVEAIKDFYAHRYVHAEAKLHSYLLTATPKSKGAASFYLGATRLCRQLLETPPAQREAVLNDAQVQQAFRDARVAGYQPLAKYVSPLMLKAWQVSQAADLSTAPGAPAP